MPNHIRRSRRLAPAEPVAERAAEQDQQLEREQIPVDHLQPADAERQVLRMCSLARRWRWWRRACGPGSPAPSRAARSRHACWRQAGPGVGRQHPLASSAPRSTYAGDPHAVRLEPRARAAIEGDDLGDQHRRRRPQRSGVAEAGSGQLDAVVGASPHGASLVCSAPDRGGRRRHRVADVEHDLEEGRPRRRGTASA